MVAVARAQGTPRSPGGPRGRATCERRAGAARWLSGRTPNLGTPVPNLETRQAV